MNHELTTVVGFCKKHDKIACYGAAQYGYIVKKFLEAQNIKIDFFIVSENVRPNKLYYGIPVKCVKNINFLQDNIGVILSLSPMHYSTVRMSLKEKKLKDSSIFEITDQLVTEMDQIIAVKERYSVLNRKNWKNELAFEFEKRKNLIKKQHKSVRVEFMLANSIGSIGAWLCYYYRKKNREENVFELYYPKELMRTYSDKSTIANEYLLSKLTFNDMEILCEDCLGFWQYFYQTEPELFVFDEAIGFVTDLMDVNQLLKQFEWDKNYISFTSMERDRAIEAMRRMGIQIPYICIANRDDAYYHKRNMQSRARGDIYRNSSIITRKKCIRYLTEQKIQSVRMGTAVKEVFAQTGLVDYASRYHTQFMDVYLTSQCKFFISDLCGILALPAFFSKPQVITNVALHTVRHDGMHLFSREKDIAIFKKMWDKKNNRYLTLREILEIESDRRYSYNMTDNTLQLYSELGIVPIENTEEEIFEVVQEMNRYQDGTPDLYDVVDYKLQEKYRKIVDEYATDDTAVLTWKIGAAFLRKNQWLLD